jgi:hypothetical protein
MNTLYKQVLYYTPLSYIQKQHENKYTGICDDFTYGNYYD